MPASKEYMKQWRLKNIVRLTEYSRKYSKDNKERIKEYNKTYVRSEVSRLNKNQKQKEYVKNYPELHKKQQRSATLKKKYGIDLVEFTRLVENQNSTCPICLRIFKDKVDPCVDHCHFTNKIRGVLCRQCNAAIGQLGDTKECLERAMNYLAKE